MVKEVIDTVVLHMVVVFVVVVLVVVVVVVVVLVTAATPGLLVTEVVVGSSGLSGVDAGISWRDRTSRELSKRRAHGNMRVYRARVFMN